MQSNHLSDLFSLAVICYEMLTGELPYKPNVTAKNNLTHYQQWHYRSIKHNRSDLPLWLDVTLQQATQANPDLRSQAFSEFYANLSKPSIEAIDEYKSLPLIQRNPIKFWQGISLVLFVCLMLSLFSQAH
jgi:serine/threonine protein kinase